jgi:SAM-dependent methyltransferase
MSSVPGTDARRSAPAALRNREAITREVRRLAPTAGRALEIASGSGEHVVRFAAAMPGLTWYPTDPDPGQRASIAAWSASEGLHNVRPPSDIDAGERGWADREAPADLVVLINLLHLVPDAAAWTALDGIAQVLRPGGVAVIYGPFLRDGETTSEGDAAFHASLRARDPRTGYKDIADVVARLASAGLTHVETVGMPANNLLLAFEKS